MHIKDINKTNKQTYIDKLYAQQHISYHVLVMRNLIGLGVHLLGNRPLVSYITIENTIIM